MPIILPSSLHELALFAGAGGGILGGKLLGWKCVCAVEYEPAARRMLDARQDDGCLEPFPIWDDVRTFDGKPWCGLVDVVSGGFPCQDISAAGKGAGLDGERSGLWKQMSRIIGEVRPQFALVENSPVLTSRGLGTVLGDLAAMGYDARWGVLGAIDAGAPHKRERIWIVAESRSAGAGSIMGEAGDSLGRASGKHVPTLRQAHGADGSNRTDSTGQSADVGNTSGIGWNEEQTQDNLKRPRLPSEARRSSGANGGSWWASEPNVGRVAHGVASRVDRLRAIGNGQVPAVVRLAWELLKPNK